MSKNDKVLDVGCGRGYFSIAAAHFSKEVVGVDLMNGMGRNGWWENFKTSMHELNLDDKVSGFKTDGRLLPFKTNSFTVAAAVHSIRNFQTENSVKKAVDEMKRIVAKGGRVVVAENLPVASNKSQEAHLLMSRCRVKYTRAELDFLPRTRMAKMFQEVGFEEIEVRELNYDLSAAPPLFCIDPYLPSLTQSEREEALGTYNYASAKISEWGEASPPVLLIKATK